MARLITFCCDGCGAQHTETDYGAGAPGWFGFKGVVLTSSDDERVQEPVFCPECKETLIEAAKDLRRRNGLDPEARE